MRRPRSIKLKFVFFRMTLVPRDFRRHFQLGPNHVTMSASYAMFNKIKALETSFQRFQKNNA